MKENQLIQEVQQLYYNNNLQNCINKVNEIDQNQQISIQQTLQIYKGLSLIKSGFVKDGLSCFKKLFEEKQVQIGYHVDTIDLVIKILYQIELYYYQEYQSEQENDQLLQICELYKQQNEKSPHYSQGIYLLGKGVHLFIHNLKEDNNLKCLQYLKEAKDLVEDYKLEVMIFLGQVYFTVGKLECALQITKELYEMHPKYPYCMLNLAQIYSEMKLYNLAEQLYKDAEKFCPFNTEILQKIGQYYSILNNNEQAKIYFEKAYNIGPRTGKSCLLYGKILSLTGFQKEGIQKFKEGIMIDPSYPDNYEKLALLDVDKNQAIRFLQKCVKLRQNSSNYYLLLGQVLIDQHRYEEAIQFLNLSLEFKSKSKQKCNIYTQLGICYIYLEEFERSLESIFQACNYELQDDQLIGFIASIINNYKECKIPYKNILLLINSQYGNIQAKFLQFQCSTTDTELKSLFNYRLDNYRTLLEMMALQNHVQQYLIHQSNLSHFDLYID